MTDPSPAASDRDAMPRWVPRAVALFWAGLATLWLLRGALHALRPLLLMLLVSVFLAFAIEPAVNRMERRGIRRGVGTGLVFLVIIVAIGGFGFAMGNVAAQQIERLVADAPTYLDNVQTWLKDHLNVDVDLGQLRDQFLEGGSARSAAQDVAGNLLDFGTTVLNVLFQTVSVALFTFYLVADGPRLRRAVCSLLPQARQRQVVEAWDIAIEKTGGYLASRAILAALSATAHAIAFAVIGVPFPVPLGIWVGLLSQFIPVIGTYLAGALPVLIAVIDNPAHGLWALVFVVVYQQIENYLFLPRITARTMELHVAVAFGSVIAGAAILGPVGAVLSLPAAATIQAVASGWAGRHEVDEELLAERERAQAEARARRTPRRRD